MKVEATINLESLVIEIQQAGQEWIEAKLRSDQLEDGEKNFLAALINSLDDAMKGQKVSETKLERLARGSADFREYVTGKCCAIAETARKRVRYESLRDLFEARRSEFAFERAKLEKGIYHIGQ